MDNKEFENINVIPLVDIMLVLLTIVLTTATFIVKGEIPVEMPRAESANTGKVEKAFVITITREGNIFFEGKEINIRNLEQQLKELTTDSLIQIKADKASRVEYLISVLDLLNKYRFRNVSILVRKE
ncbi:MAG TPA: biopolymer transporter ExbD [Aquificaceae bacterium]|nr:biopolymer transporter ExbD [Aquificaceae bacterium]HIQ49083.1 biopolymer transporter ExbD [Aquifex aeolicus]